MKVALSFPGCHRRGGVERIMLECALFLASREHEVQVFANEWDQEFEGIKFVHVPMKKRPPWAFADSYFQNATAALQGAQFDALNVHGCVCPVGGVHWVQSVQAAWLEQSRRMRSPLSLARWRQRLNPLHPVLLRLEEQHFARRQYKKVIVTTAAVREDLHRLYDVPREDVEIVPNGFSLGEFNPARRLERRDEQRARWNLKPDDVALLFVANELDRKGYATILAALQRVPDPRLKVLVVGRPPIETVQARAGEAGVADRVIACGSTGDVAALHAAADAFVLPTQYEAFCLAILEALGSGLPVLTTKVPGAQDAILPGVNGLLLDDPKDGEGLAAQFGCILDDAQRAKLAEAASGSVESYQWPRVLEHYEAILQSHRA